MIRKVRFNRVLSVVAAACLFMSCLLVGNVALVSAESYAGGSGTESDPYRIATAEQLAAIRTGTTSAGVYYQLTADVTVNNVSLGQNNGKPEAFEGVFDGAGYTITYSYASSTAYGGLFSALKGATVKNLTVEGAVTQTGFVFGTIAGVAYGGAVIENCISRVTISGAHQWVGGIVGAMGGATLRMVENNGSVTTDTQRVDPLGNIAAPSSFNLGVGMGYDKNNTAVGGVVAITSGSNTLENVLNTGDVTNNLADGNVETAGVVAMDWNQNNAERRGNLKLIAVGNTGTVKATRVRPSSGVNNDRTGGVYANLENTTVTLDRVWSAGTVTAAVDAGGTANWFTGAVGGGDGGSMTVVNPSVYYVPGKLTNKKFNNNSWFHEAVGKSNVRDSFNGHIFADGKDVDMRSAAFAALLGGGWTMTPGGYPTLLHAQKVLEPYAGGSGTALDPYRIATVGQLERLNAEVLAGKTDGVYYRLTADLTVEGLSIGQNLGDPIPFAGVFDGYYHTIQYTYGSATPYGGLFSVLKGATVKNLVMDGTVTETGIVFGSVAGAAYDGAVIENCVSRVNISGAKEWVGGIVGMMGGATLRRVQNDGSVTSDTKRIGSLSGTQDVKQYGIKVYDPNNTAIAGIVAVTSGNNVLEDVLNTGDITNNLTDGNVETAGVLALDVSNAGNTLKLIAVGNTGTIRATRTRPNSGAIDDRTGGVYGQLELSTVTLDRIWNAGTVTAAVNADGTANARTGAVGGGSGGAACVIDSPKMYYVPGTLTNSQFSGTRKNEAVGVANGYKGNQVFESGMDLKSAEFVAILGENWSQAADEYPVLRIQQAALRDLLLTNAETGKAIALEPEFDGAVTEYTIKVAYPVERVIIQADPAYAGAVVTGATGVTALQVGQNVLTVKVQGADGSTRDYVVRIKRTSENPSNDATLKSLSLSGVQLNEKFSASRTEYTATVPWQVETVTLAAEVNNVWAELTGTGEKALEIGENPLYVTVTAEDDSQKTYTVRVNREPLFRQGSGTEADPYQIETEQDLRNFSAATNRMAGTTWAGVYFRLTADIDLRNEQWTPIATGSNNAFGGVFDGAGYTVKNLKIDVDNDTVAHLDTQRSVDGLGLFGSINAGKGYTAIIRNVQVEGSILNRMTNAAKTGGIVGQVPASGGADSAPLIENCTFRGSVASNKEGVGGILGEAPNSSVRIVRCTNYGSVSVPTAGYKPQRSDLLRCAGGIVGAVYCNNLETVIQNCTNYGAVTGAYMIGGIVGRLSQCVGLNQEGLGYNLGILAEDGYQAEVTYCANYGAITKGDYEVNAQGSIGGLIGITTDGAADIRHDGAILFDHLYNVGTVTAMDYFDVYLGGVFGAHNLLGEIRNCYNMGRIVVSEERDLTGAIAGVISERTGGKQALVENCYYWGASNLEGIPIGFAGDTEGVVEAKSRIQFGSGEVAFLLDGGNTDGRTYTWTQDTVHEFPVFGTGEDTAVYAEGDYYTIGRNGTAIRATIDESNEPTSGDDDGDDTYPVELDADKVDAFLDEYEKIITLFSDDVAIWEINDALRLNQVTVRYFDWFGREIYNDEVVLQTDMMMKVYRADGSLLDTFTFCIDGEEISDPSERVATGEFSYVPIALLVLVGAALVVVFLGRKKRAKFVFD